MIFNIRILINTKVIPVEICPKPGLTWYFDFKHLVHWTILIFISARFIYVC